MEENMKIQIIVGSARQARATGDVAKWVASKAEAIEGAEFELVDLRDYELPFFNEAVSPKYNPGRTPDAAVKKWLDKVAEADGYAIVTPEYNRSLPAVLKNALDTLDYQIDRKPVAVIGHGGNGATRAIDHIRLIVAELGAVTVPKYTALNGMVAAGGIVDEDGKLAEELVANPYGPEAALSSTLTSLVWYTTALKTAREA